MNTSNPRHRRALTWLVGILALLAPHLALAGSLIVSNLTVIPLKLSDEKGFELGQVGAGRSISLVLEDGAHTLKASRLSGAPYAQVKLSVSPAGGPTWQILPTEGILEVRNLTTEPLTILVDDQPLADVAANDVVRLDGMRPGTRALKAVHQGEVKAMAVADVSANGTFVWRLTQAGLAEAQTGMIQVANFSGEPVDIYVNGKKRVGMSPGDSAAMVGIPTERVRVTAKSSAGAIVSEQELDLSASATQRWIVTGPDGGRAVIDIQNHTTDPLRVCVDGAWCLKIDPRGEAQYDAIKPGRHTFQAYSLTEDRLLKAVDLDLGVGTPYRWVVEEPDR